MNDNNGETVIDLLELLGLFIRKIWIVATLTVLGGIMAFVYTFFFVTPQFKSSALLYVNNSDISLGSTSFSISNADLNAAKSLVATYSVILESRSVINEVISRSGVNYSYEKMKSMVEANAVNNTEVFSITVTSPDPKEAETLANLYAEVLPAKITEIVNGSDSKIVDYAVVASKRSSPSYTKNTAVGALLGFVIAAAFIVIGYLRDDIIHSEEYITKTYPNIPLLTVVPDLIASRTNGYGYYSAYAKKGNTNNNSNMRPGSTVANADSGAETSSPFVIQTKNETEGEKNG